ncbi:MAG TPA: universal stress protein [Patescibacteria group bacterium]|nr:universal stress protein [Patescibacteria group bacterium]
MERILLAYDGGEPARRALDMAAQLALAFRAALSVVSVVPVGPDGKPTEPWDGGEARARDLHEAQRILARHGLSVDLLEPLGDPARTIERIACEGGFDTIVIGSRGPGAHHGTPQGSVCEHVVTHATATVVVTH